MVGRVDKQIVFQRNEAGRRESVGCVDRKRRANGSAGLRHA